MKKILFLSLLSAIFFAAFAQAPQLLNYQAVVRDNTGQPVATNTSVALTFTIHTGSAGGATTYTETITTTANNFGLVVAQIGSTGNLSTVNWTAAGGLFLQVQAAIAGGAVTDMGTTQLASVPFAMYAGNNWGLAGNNIDAGSFVGTTNGHALNFKVNNKAAGRIDTAYEGSMVIGYDALDHVSTGISNTAFGYQGLHTTTTGSDNTALGFSSLYDNTTGAENTALGALTIHYNTTGNYNTASGSRALTSNTTGGYNVANGYKSLFSNTAGSYNTAIGESALFSNTDGNYNIAIGEEALYDNTHGVNNTATGSSSLYHNSTGNDNTSNGYEALYDNMTGSQNTAIGSGTLFYNTDGSYNTATGYKALNVNLSGVGNTGTGWEALYLNTGSNNTAMGFKSMIATTTGSNNTAIGTISFIKNTNGAGNTAVGYGALDSSVSNDNNTAIGAGADIVVTNPGNNVAVPNATAIGYNAKAFWANGMQFGNTDVHYWVFGSAHGNFTGICLKVGSTSSDGNGAYLTTGGAWTSTSSRDKKEDFTALNKSDVLSKIQGMDIAKWKYIGTDEYHIGPVAEDFYDAFHVGLDNKAISSVDPAGVALVAIQALNEKIEKLEKEIQTLKGQNK